MSGHPLDPLLDEWANHCRRDGWDLRMRVYRALGAPGPWSARRLRVTLRSLLVLDPSEREAFEALYARVIPADPEWLPVLTSHPEWDQDRALAVLRDAAPEPPPEFVSRGADQPIDTASPPTVADTSRPPVAPGRIEAPVPPVDRRGLLALLTALLAIAVWWGLPSTPTVHPPATHDAGVQRVDAAVHADAAVPDTVVVTQHVDAPDPGVVPTLVRVDMADATQPAWRRWLRHLGYSLLGAMVVWEAMLLVDLFARWRLAQPVKLTDPQRIAVSEDGWRERQLDVSSPFPLAPPIDGAALDALAWRVGFSDDALRPVLDVAASVMATARAGGMVDVVYRSGRKASVLCLARPPALDPVAELVFTCLAEGLRARGVQVEVVTDDAPSVADLTLVLLDAREPLHQRVEAWMRRPHVALVEVRDPGLWGDELKALPHAPFAFDAEGLAAALDAARTERRPRKPTTFVRATPRERLGNAARLAAACAWCAPFDLGVADALRRAFAPRLGFLALQRVLALDGVVGDASGWQMSAGLRRWLHAPGRWDDEFEREVMAWQRTRLAQTTAPKGSRAAAWRDQEVAWLDLLLGRVRDVSSWRVWLAVVEPQLGHAVLEKVFQERRAVLGEGVTLPEGEDIESREVRERLARIEMATRDPVTVAWPQRWPRLALESIVAALALSGAVYATVVMNEPRTEWWNGTRSREVGSARGRAFTIVCGESYVVWIGPATKGAVVLGCGPVISGRETRQVALSPLQLPGRPMPPQPSLSTFSVTGVQGQYQQVDGENAPTLAVVGTLSRGVSTRDVDLRSLQEDDHDFLLTCGRDAVLQGVYGHMSADGNRVVGLGILCVQRVVREH